MKTIKAMNNNSKYITDDMIAGIIKKPTLTIEDIKNLTGLTYYSARLIRLEIVERESNFLYSTQCNIRTDHFLKFYENNRLNKIYHDVFGVDPC